MYLMQLHPESIVNIIISVIESRAGIKIKDAPSTTSNLPFDLVPEMLIYLFIAVIIYLVAPQLSVVGVKCLKLLAEIRGSPKKCHTPVIRLETPCSLRISLMNALLLYERFCRHDRRFHYSTLYLQTYHISGIHYI